MDPVAKRFGSMQMNDASTSRLQVLDWGLLPYGEALKLQEALVSERLAEISPDRLVVVEHPPVITIGRSGSSKDLRESEAVLNSRGALVFLVDRGGMATFHGPGQLVAYPILKLKIKDLHLYLKMLLDTVAAVLRDYGLNPGFRKGRPGVWAGPAKIASVGISARKWVTYHGIALNVNTDLNWFDTINPCGNPEEKITSMSRELGRPLDLGEVKERFIETFCRVFGYPARPEVCRRPKERPSWLVLPAPNIEALDRMRAVLAGLHLGTVCESANCPNLGECFGRGTATFMILGGTCTRRCRFCAVEKGVPGPVEKDEPERVARAVHLLRLKHAVITSVTRDDLPDGGAGHFVRTLETIRSRCPDVSVEVLVPDFGGSLPALQEICDGRPDVFAHNVETVARLYPLVRPPGPVSALAADPRVCRRPGPCRQVRHYAGTRGNRERDRGNDHGPWTGGVLVSHAGAVPVSVRRPPSRGPLRFAAGVRKMGRNRPLRGVQKSGGRALGSKLLSCGRNDCTVKQTFRVKGGEPVAGKRFVVEIGTGIDLHGEDATKAACRAVRDAVSRSCLCGIVEIMGIQDLNSLDVEIVVAVPRPQNVDLEQVKAQVPIGRKTALAVEGGMTVKGLCVARFAADCDQVLVANAAITVFVEK